MDLPWWSWIVIPAGVILGVVLIGLLFYYVFGPDSDIRGKLDRNKQIYAFSIVEKYKVPDPPIVYCPECGVKLEWEYISARSHYFGKHNPVTGNEWYIVKARYICPTNGQHHLGEAVWGAVYWTESKNGGCGGWYWQTPFVLTYIKTDITKKV